MKFMFLMLIIECICFDVTNALFIKSNNQTKPVLSTFSTFSAINRLKKLNDESIVNRKHIINKFNNSNKNNNKNVDNDTNLLSFLWRIKKMGANDDSSNEWGMSYLFGTIHVPYTRVWDSLSNRVKKAFQRSDSVFFELDLLNPNTVMSLAKCQMLPKGERLADILPTDLYRRLVMHLDYVSRVLPQWLSSDQTERRLYAEYLFNAITHNWQRKRPVWVMLMVNALTETDIKSRGIPVLDLYLAQEAQRLNKNVGSIENVKEQCSPLNGLNNSRVLFALNQTLSQHEAIRFGTLRPKGTTDDLIRHYICGDLNEIIFNQDTTHVPILENSTMYNNEEELESARYIDDYFRSELIAKRNKRMGGRVLELLNSKPDHSFFFAFGAGHFLGNYSLLNIIEESGYEVVRVNEIHNTKIKAKRLSFRCKPQQNLRDVRLPYQTVTQNVFPLSSKKFDVNNNLIIRTKDNTEQQADRPDRPVTKIRVNNNNNNNNNNKLIGKLYTPLLPESTISSLLLRAKWTTSIVSTTSSTILVEHYSSSTQQPRKFNDLWVRLETVSTKPPLLIHGQQLLTDIEVAKNNVRVWYTIASNHSKSILNVNSHSIFIIMIIIIILFKIIII